MYNNILILFLFLFIFIYYIINSRIEKLTLQNTILQNKNIPKIIWGYWNNKNNIPLLVTKCYKNWEHFNPDWKINLLNDDNLNLYLNENELKSLNNINKIQKKSDLIRLYLLSKYGGIWSDSSIFLTESLDWVLNLQQNKKFDIFTYEADFFTTIKNKPVLENWFIACIPNTKFINLWKNNFKNYLKIGFKNYMKKLGNNFNIQKIDNPKYLTMHVAGLNIQYNNNNLNIYTLPASQGPFYYQVKYNWNKQKTINYMLNNKLNLEEVRENY